MAKAANLPQLGEMSTWIGLVAPAGTDSAIVAKISAEVRHIYADPGIVHKLDSVGIAAESSSPAEFDAFFRPEVARWTKIYRQSGIGLN